MRLSDIYTFMLLNAFIIGLVTAAVTPNREIPAEYVDPANLTAVFVSE